MPIKEIEIEKVENYKANSPADIKWCKENLAKAKKNPSLGYGASQKIKQRLFEGIKIKNRESKESAFRRFDYPLPYIQRVLNPSSNTWNKWVILVATEYTEDDLEDINNITAFFETDQVERYEGKKKKKKVEEVSATSKILNSGKIKKPIASLKKPQRVLRK